jgi:UDP-N-acetylmuramoyl-tripeptide--D-alanyl-D-alanine ligase
MLAAILSFTGPGLKTSGNLNNLIGLPHMLFQLDPAHRWAILEMGMSELGEIDRLAEMARPGIGVITNAFPAHLASMGNVETVARAKGELFLRLPPKGWAIYNADDPLISSCPVSDEVRRISFGFGAAEVSVRDIKSLGTKGQQFTLLLPGHELQLTMRAFGRHNIANAMAAAAAAFVLGVKPQLIREGLEYFTPYDKRFKLEETGGLVLIDDSYNANPKSVEAALLTIKELKQGNRAIAILGDMLELGEGTEAAHRHVGAIAAQCVDRLYVMGELSGNTAEGALSAGLSQDAVIQCPDHKAIMDDLESVIAAGDYILVKGSRGMRMETIAEGIRRWSAAAPRKG